MARSVSGGAPPPSRALRVSSGNGLRPPWTAEPLHPLRSATKGQAGACPDRTQAIPCKVQQSSSEDRCRARCVPDRTVERGHSPSLTETRPHRLTCIDANQRPQTRSLPSWCCRPFRAATDRLRPKWRAPKARSKYSLPNASHLSPGLLLTYVRRQAKRSVIHKIDVESALFTFIRAAGQLLTPPHLGAPLRWTHLSLMFVGRHQFPYVTTGQFTKPGRLPEVGMRSGERHGHEALSELLMGQHGKRVSSRPACRRQENLRIVDQLARIFLRRKGELNENFPVRPLYGTLLPPHQAYLLRLTAPMPDLQQRPPPSLSAQPHPPFV